MRSLAAPAGGDRRRARSRVSAAQAAAVPPARSNALRARVGHQLELHAPWRQEVDPALALRRAFAGGGLAKDGGCPCSCRKATAASRSSTYSATWWPPMSLLRGRRRLVGRGVLEHLEDRLAAAAEEVQLLASRRAGATARCSVIQPSSVAATNGPRRVEVLAAEDVDEEGSGPRSRSGTVTPMWSSPVRPGRVSCRGSSSWGGAMPYWIPTGYPKRLGRAPGVEMGSDRCHAGVVRYDGREEAAMTGAPSAGARPPRGSRWSEPRPTGTPRSPRCSPRYSDQLVLIRTFEELVLTLAGEGLVHGPAHSSIGQEGGAVGWVLGLTSDDRRSDAGARHRRQHGNLQRRQRRAAAPALLYASGSARVGARKSGRPQSPRCADVPARTRTSPPAFPHSTSSQPCGPSTST